MLFAKNVSNERQQTITIIIMGCAPAERSQQSAACNPHSTKKFPPNKCLKRNASRNSSYSTERQLQASVEKQSSTQSWKQLHRNTQNSLSLKQKSSGTQPGSHFSINLGQSVNSKSATPHVIRLSPIKQKPKQEPKVESSKIISVHSLALQSVIKGSSKDIRATFPNQEPIKDDIPKLFGHQNWNRTLQSSDSHTSAHKSQYLGMGKRWREQTLRRQLLQMTNQSIGKTPIQAVTKN